MSGKKATHKVTCSVCGRRGSVEIKEGGRIADKKWSFFGRFVVEMEATKYLTHEDSMPSQIPGSEPAKHVEYWECEDCFKDNEQLLKNER